VTLPEGAKARAVHSLRVWTSGGAEQPDASGKVKVTVFNDGPQYTEARDPEGRLVVAGFLGKNGTALDAASTAEMLTYFATGAPMATGDARRQVFDGLRDLRGFEAVVAEVESDLRTDGYLTPNDPAMLAKLDAIVAGIGGEARVSTRGAVVTPETQLSGVSIDTTVDGELRLENVYLRRAMAWLEKVSYTVKRGESVTIVLADPPSEPVKPFEIAAPKRYAGFVGTIADLFQGNVAYSPTSTGPFEIPAIDPQIEGCIGTNYHLTMVGPGLTVGNRGDLTTERREEANRFVVKAAMLDYLLPFLVTVVIPIQGELLDDFLKYTGGSAILQDMLTTVFATAPGVADLVWQGKYYDATIAMRDAGLLSSTFLPGVTQLFLNWAADSSSDQIAGMAERYANDAQAILGTIGNIDKWLSILETGIVGADLANSKMYELARIESTSGKVTLTPAKNVLPAQETTTVTAVIQDKNPSAVYQYEWRVSEGFRLNDSFGKTTDDSPDGVLTTSQESVAVESKENEPGVATIRCKVTRVDGPRETTIDDAMGTVTFADGIEVTPTPAIVDTGRTLALTARYLGPETVFWKFALADTRLGTIDRTEIGSNPTVNFKAGNERGAAILTVTGYLDAGGTQTIGSAEVTIRVGRSEGAPVTPTFSYETIHNGGAVYATGAVYFWAVGYPRVQGALGYKLLRDGVEVSRWSANMDGPISDSRFTGTGSLMGMNAVSWGNVAPEKVSENLAKYMEEFQTKVNAYAWSIVPILTEDEE
jgi:hypothetical protein